MVLSVVSCYCRSCNSFGLCSQAVSPDAAHTISHHVSPCIPVFGVLVQIGSGFDVCSAVYGSITYRRIPPRVMEVCMARVEAAISGSTAAGPHALEVAKELWSLGTGTTSMESEAGEAWTFTAVRQLGLLVCFGCER